MFKEKSNIICYLKNTGFVLSEIELNFWNIGSKKHVLLQVDSWTPFEHICAQHLCKTISSNVRYIYPTLLRGQETEFSIFLLFTGLLWPTVSYNDSKWLSSQQSIKQS